MIRSTGFFRSKTKSIRGAASAIVAQHGGRVPDTMEKLNGLPGVGRKTANVVLGNAFQKDEGIVVDTHVIRLSHRFRITRQTDPEKIEQTLMKLVPKEHWTNWSHWLIWHGRRRCFARKPDCHRCEIFNLCPSGKLVHSQWRSAAACRRKRRDRPSEFFSFAVSFNSCTSSLAPSAFSAELFEFTLERLQLVVGKFFEIDQLVPGAAQGTDQLIQFQMHRLCVAVLCVLNQKHHQESDDGRAGVDDELPGIGVIESVTGRAQTTMMRMATTNAQALPRTVEVLRAKTPNASRIRQNRSRSLAVGLAVFPRGRSRLWFAMCTLSSLAPGPLRA